MSAAEKLMDRYSLHITLLEDMLGTVPKDQGVLESYVRDLARKKHPEETMIGAEDEMIPETPEDVDTRASTGFYANEDGFPILLDYQIKGWLKECANVLKDNLGVKNARSHVNNDVFVRPRQMVLAEGPDGDLQRPLRAMTMQGPRVTVVSSDLIAAGRSWTWELLARKGSKVTQEVLEDICSWGEFTGLGQWRNGGYGRIDAVLTRK